MDMKVSQRFSRQKKHINDVLNYVRANRAKSLQLEELARIACMSPFHFHRVFNACVGESLRQHIQRIRLEQAALRLRSTQESVSDIAVTTGYRSHTAFSRAFSQHFGVSPTEYRDGGAARTLQGLSAIPPAESLPTWSFEDADPINVIYIRRVGPYESAASDAWRSMMQYAYANHLFRHTTTQIGIAYDSPEVTPEENIQYDACLSTPLVHPDGEVCVQTIAGGRFAVFDHDGPYETLGRTYDTIYREWLFSSDVTLADSPSFAVYPNTQSPNGTGPTPIRIYIPVTT